MSFITIGACARGCVAALLLAPLLLPASVAARTLAEVQARGEISMCANPDALPHASEKGEAPGFQVEIGRELAAALGLKLHVDWIIPRLRAGLVDCDMLFDTIVDPATQRGAVKLSLPYQKSGVALALRPGNDSVRGFQDVAPGQRVGVMINSLASKLLNQRGLYTVPYAFENDMVADLAKGDLDACAVSPATIAYYIRRHPEAGLRYVHAYEGEPELRWNLAVALRRSDDALVEAVDKALRRMRTDGTLERIYASYGVAYRQP
jgi:polar amino acid transport system substrate-binding protein